MKNCLLLFIRRNEDRGFAVVYHRSIAGAMQANARRHRSMCVVFARCLVKQWTGEVWICVNFVFIFIFAAPSNNEHRTMTKWSKNYLWFWLSDLLAGARIKRDHSSSTHSVLRTHGATRWRQSTASDKSRSRYLNGYYFVVYFASGCGCEDSLIIQDLIQSFPEWLRCESTMTRRKSQVEDFCKGLIMNFLTVSAWYVQQRTRVVHARCHHQSLNEYIHIYLCSVFVVLHRKGAKEIKNNPTGQRACGKIRSMRRNVSRLLWLQFNTSLGVNQSVYTITYGCLFFGWCKTNSHWLMLEHRNQSIILVLSHYSLYEK